MAKQAGYYRVLKGRRCIAAGKVIWKKDKRWRKAKLVDNMELLQPLEDQRRKWA